MLQVREDTLTYRTKALPWLAGDGCTDPREIIVFSPYAASEQQIVGFNQHLEEGVIPSNSNALTNPNLNAFPDELIQRRDFREPGVNVSRWHESPISV
jgi:hypothetical protein